jgi:hypothetical protein
MNKSQYIIQQSNANNQSNLGLVSENDILGGNASPLVLAVYHTEKECRAAIRELLETKPENAPYKIIRMHFSD